MRTRLLPLHLRWTGLFLLALVCATVVPAAAQQAAPSAATATAAVQAPAPAPVPEASPPEASTSLSGPRVPAPAFQDAAPAHNSAQANVPAQRRENHTIVISTLGIVLVTIIVVLLLVH